MGKLGMRRRAPHQADVARNVIWQSMRKLRRFTRSDLMAVAEAKRDNVNKFVLALVSDGYLRVVQPKREGVIGGDEVLMLVRNTGPVAPRVTDEGLYDANLADPYTLSPSKRLAKHAPALLKALREIVDAAGDQAKPDRLREAIAAGAYTLGRHDGEIA